VTSGIATGWSGSGMWRWAAHPGIGGPGDRSSTVGWGVAGLYSALATGQRAFAIALLVVAAVRIAMLAARSGTGRMLAAAVVVNAGGAFLMSSWYQALRLDFWGLGLVPLAVGAGAGTPVFGRRRTWRRVGAIVVSVVLVGSLLAWNSAKEVAPSLRRSDANARTVAAIEAHLQRDAFIVSSLLIAGRLADAGYRAEPGYAAVVHGDLRPGVYVTSDAFHFTQAQLDALGTGNPTDTLATTPVATVGTITLSRVTG